MTIRGRFLLVHLACHQVALNVVVNPHAVLSERDPPFPGVRERIDATILTEAVDLPPNNRELLFRRELLHLAVG